MPDESKERDFVQLEQHVAYYSGPLPPPELMRGYEDVLEGSADRILATMEREQKQRARYETLGLLLAFAVAMSLVALSAYALSLGSVAASIGVIVAGIASTAGTFIYGNRTRRQLLRDRREAMQNPPPRPALPEGDSNPS